LMPRREARQANRLRMVLSFSVSVSMGRVLL
jgi:hypothetical protein